MDSLVKVPGADIFPTAEGGAKICGVFRVKNHDFTPKNHIFSNFRGDARRVRPLWIRPWVPPYSKLNFQGKIFFIQNWCDITLIIFDLSNCWPCKLIYLQKK
jgi:hypothetical protein